MDAYTRKLLNEADQINADCDYYLAKREQQREHQRQQEHERLVVREWLTRAASDEVKTTDYTKRGDGGNTGTGNDEAWNAWGKSIARAEVVKAVKEYDDQITKDFNQLVSDLKKYDGELQQRFNRRREHFETRDNDLSGRIEELEARLGELEGRVADLEGSGDAQKIVPLLTLKSGGRDAA